MTVKTGFTACVCNPRAGKSRSANRVHNAERQGVPSMPVAACPSLFRREA